MSHVAFVIVQQISLLLTQHISHHSLTRQTFVGSLTIWPVYAYTLAAQKSVIKLLMLMLNVEDYTSMSYEDIHE